MAEALDSDTVARYLADRLDAPVEVDGLHQTFPGLSQETYLIRARVAGREAGYVLRRNPPGGGIVPFPLKHEWEIYLRLFRADAPVAEPLWYDDDEAGRIGGRPLFVRKLVEGSTDVEHVRDPSPEYDEVRKDVAIEHARLLARLHSIDWRKHGFDEVLPAPERPDDAASLEIETWWSIWEECRREPRPEITAAFEWFRRNLPRTAPRVCILKGNNGLGEEIWQGRKIAALSDFEFASIGDPCQDWGFSQGMLSLWDREGALEAYESEAGYELPRENIVFYERWAELKAVVSLSAGLRSMIDGTDQRAALASLGLLLTGLLETQVFQAVFSEQPSPAVGGST